ncbi:MAG: DEAD/DEAH box helicase [Eubacteriales bacterium]
MNNVIKNIITGINVNEIYEYAKRKLFAEGPTSTTVLEILSYLCIFQPEYFATIQKEVLGLMGVFFKDPTPISLQSALFEIYHRYIQDKYKQDYTPVQASIVNLIEKNKNFSFSAPTSTGKSFVFRNIIENANRDVVIIVPSRALINEYYDRICNIIPDKTVNVLTYVDVINTKHAKRTIFILTPERAKELFKFRTQLNVEIFLFDEAQLSNEDSRRGLYFDSIVRRVQKSYPLSKCVFAHPFVSNPEAQLKKNEFDLQESLAIQYQQKNVGQIFFAHDGSDYYHFGIDKDIMGSRKIKSSYDPILDALQKKRSVLVYTTKASIFDKSVFRSFQKYLELCPEIINPNALKLIEQLNHYIGSTSGGFFQSTMMRLIRRGIVTHHGSLPLQARLILEHFTQQGFCRICFATSTLEQGINMPFDVVYLNTFEASKTLSMKNLIGRAGRSTEELKFDYGSVVVKNDNLSNFRHVMLQTETLSEVSLLDVVEDGSDDLEFKEAIKNGEFSDEFNLTNIELERLSEGKLDRLISFVLDHVFNRHGQLITLREINQDQKNKLLLYSGFIQLYRHYLGGRELSDGEESVLNTAVKILIWKIHLKTFKEICRYRYAFAARIGERRELIKQGRIKTADALLARFIRGFDDLPNGALRNYSLYNNGTKATDVDYDRIVFDTYDYLDKLISFRLSDIYYAIFYKYYERSKDTRAHKLAQYLRFGTDDEKEIMLLRYGLSFEEIEWVKDYVIQVDTQEIIFNPAISTLESHKLASIERFIH